MKQTKVKSPKTARSPFGFAWNPSVLKSFCPNGSLFKIQKTTLTKGITIAQLTKEAKNLFSLVFVFCTI